MQKPSIGRIVHAFKFTPKKDDEGKVVDGVEGDRHGPFAAIVTAVHSERVVNLTAFGTNQGAEALEVTSATYDEDSAIQSGWSWTWPPKA